MMLSGEQQQAIENGVPVTLQVAGTDCILVRKDVYLRMEADFDAAPWSSDEMNLLADEADAMISQRECDASGTRTSH